MYIVTFETPDAEVFKKAANYLKKLNVKIKVVEQDTSNDSSEIEEDDFEKEWAQAIPADEVYERLKTNLSKHFDENGVRKDLVK